MQRNGKVETGGAEISNGYELNCYVRQWNSDDLIGNGKAPSSMVMLRNGKVTYCAGRELLGNALEW